MPERSDESITQTATEPRGGSAPFAPPASPSLGSRDPARYAVIAEHGRGGLGRVVRAFDHELGREVAIKEILESSGTQEARFVREAMITARLEHPSIVPVHDAGRWPDGTPFYAMKLVSGRSLKDVLRASTSFADRLRHLPAILAISDAIAYAHNHRILHRDLKPSNVIIGAHGETVVIDWGLAKDLSSEEPEPVPAGPYRAEPSTQGLTVDGAVLGTPAYMPPEQARGEPVNERSDVYAIGAILYHLLSGRPAYGASDSAEVLALVLSGPPQDISEACPEASADLCAIVRKSMARDPLSRYHRADELAEDLRRYQLGQWVTARTYSAADVMARWARRHRTVLIMAILSLATLAAAGVVSVQRILREQQIATRKSRESLAALGREKAASMEARTQTRRLLLTQAEQLLDRDPTYSIDLLLRRGGIKDADAQAYARQAFADSISWFRRDDGEAAPAIAASRDGAAIAIGGKNLEWWDLKRKTMVLQATRTSSARTMRFSADGTFLVTGDFDGTVTVWRPSTAPVVLARMEHSVAGLDVSPDGRLVACGTSGRVTTFDLDTRDATSQFDPGERSAFEFVEFTSNGLSLIAASNLGTVGVVDVGQRTWRTLASVGAVTMKSSSLVDHESAVATWDGHQQLRICPLAGAACHTYRTRARDDIPLFMPVTHELAFCNSGYVEFVDFDGSATRQFLKGRGITRCLAVSRDGAFIAARDATGAVILLRRGDGASVTLRGHDSVDAAVFLGAGLELLTAGTEGSVRAWRAPVFPLAAWIAEGEPARTVGGSPSRDGLAIQLVDGRVAFWTTAGFRYYEPHCRVVAVQFLGPSSPSYLLCGDGLLQAIEPDGSSRSVASLASWGKAIASSSSGRYVAAASAGGRVVLIDRASSDRVSFLEQASDAIFALEFSPDERSIVGAVSSGEVRRWDLETGKSELLYQHGVNIRTLAWARDKHVIVSGGDDGEVYTFDLRTRRGAPLAMMADPVQRIRTDSTGTKVAILTASGALEVRYVDGKELFTDRGVRSMSFASSSSLLAITYDSGLLMVVDTVDARSWSVMAHPHALLFAFFLPDGQRLISVGKDRLVKIWSLADLRTETLDENAAMFSEWRSKRLVQFDE